MNMKLALPDIKALKDRIPDNTREVIVTCILSIASALSAVAFLYAIKISFALTYERFAEESPLYFIISSFILITVSSLMVGFLLTVFSPEAAGSGIPQMKAAYWKESGDLKLKPVIVKFFAGIISIGGGNSLGREGPSVYLGSGVASNLDKTIEKGERNRRAASVVGASAGLAAAFNTPLAAIAFIIEEVVGDMNNKYLGRVVISSVIGAFVVYALMGRHPSFSMEMLTDISWTHYAVVPFAAFAASYLGIIFQKDTLKLRRSIKKRKKIKPWIMPLFGGLITWVIGTSLFLFTGKLGVFSLGYNDLSELMTVGFEWKIAGILAIGKLIATISSYGFGGCGGIFAPSLFIGGFSGYFIGSAAALWLPLTHDDIIVIAAVGMSSFLGAVVQAPLTSLLIVFEMTHQFAIVPALMIGIIVSQAMARKAFRLNFYDAILIQDGNELHKIRPPVDLYSWQNLPISAIAHPNPVVLKDLSNASMKEIIENYPYGAFPVTETGELKGILTRDEIKDALKTREKPKVHEAGTCYCDETVKDVGNRFIEYDVHVLVVKNRKTEQISGIVTLRDLIRAQSAMQD
jgi:chloride channel protein, CIC family